MDSRPTDEDLFSYPGAPGHRGISTSIEAAEAIAPCVGTLRAMVLSAVDRAGETGLTVVELSQRSGYDRMSIQPRFSELRAMRQIADSGQRRKNPSGVNAIVWTTPEHALPAPRA